ncbi:MAG: hypothetical protein L0Y56_04855, partial [Nitrospira sp.]|nr:hypothetical protein [Nitrospira sp.]
MQPKWHTKVLKYLLVGEAPGAEEEKQNEGFIGPSGQFLRERLESAGIDLSECLFTNACWCGPRPSNDLSQKIGTP